jgi:hypothetical protein
MGGKWEKGGTRAERTSQKERVVPPRNFTARYRIVAPAAVKRAPHLIGEYSPPSRTM